MIVNINFLKNEVCVEMKYFPLFSYPVLTTLRANIPLVRPTCFVIISVLVQATKQSLK